MRTRRAHLALALGLVVGGSALLAPARHARADDEKAAKRSKGKPAAGAKNPYLLAVVKGEKAFVAGDVEGAVTALQDAIKLDTQSMLAFARLGEVHKAAGRLDDAEKMLEAAQSKRGTELLAARVLYQLADLRERQGKWQVAKDAWQTYADFLEKHGRDKGYPGTVAERQKALDKRIDDERAYAVVKERIKQRELDNEREARDNAAKDKGNK